MGWRTTKGSTDPGSPDFNLDPMQDPGHTHVLGNVGSNTGLTAVESAPSFSTGSALELNATQDCMLYINVKTAAALAVTFGPSTGAEYTICASETVALGVITVRVPATWLVTITGTIGDLGIIAVTC